MKIVCRDDKKNDQGLSPIYVRISHARKSKYLSTKIYVNSKLNWDQTNQKVKRGHPDATRTNAYIKKLEHEVYDVALKVNSGELAWQDVHLSPKSKPAELDFFAFGTEMVEQMDAQNQIRTSKRYKTVLNKLSKYMKGKPLEFGEITVSFLSKYETHLAKLGNKVNTRHNNLRSIRAILYRAMDHGYVDHNANPFDHFKLKTGKANRQRPNSSEIQLLEEIDRSQLSTHQKITLDAFLFSLYCAGIRVGDLLQLTPQNITKDLLSYSMDKTGKPRAITLIAKARMILETYNTNDRNSPIFPLLKRSDLKMGIRDRLNRISSVNASMNRDLKRIASHLGIEKPLSMHMARHGFSELARKKNIDVYQISKALGHSSLSVTERYLESFDVDTLTETMNKVFE